MSNEEHEIPRHGKAGVAFLGVELKDATIVIASVFIGIPIGSQIGFPGYLGVPVVGFYLNKLYIEWRKNTLPGQALLQLFKAGLAGYGRGFKAADVVIVGDATVINPGRRDADLSRSSAAAPLAAATQSPTTVGGRALLQLRPKQPVQRQQAATEGAIHGD